ncbi:bifunctional prephenate dehydrogenase/3-phosphoshikimate 1-carboxyvinyltransferase [Allohahella marinimesophila]|uniref:3-phosphoshikimate 1-carboxyvinyltransferase n=1 Tax=Allohahella marinimesophila TaxID=1054972 RepID=A0ABP7P368_9GAMM
MTGRSSQDWRKLTLGVVGLGLIGGSVCLGAAGFRGASRFGSIIGFDADPQARAQAVELGLVERCAPSVPELVQEADIIMLAVPVKAMGQVLRACIELGEQPFAGKIVSDVGSVKASVRACFEAALGGMPASVVLGHPIAGSEKSGVFAGRADLFVNHKVILTPLENTDVDAVAQISALWTLLGADVLEMTVEHHDRVLASTSHLPHLIAFSLVDTLAVQDDSLDIFRYAAGGFRDFTRIAGSDPVMWHDIFLENKTAVLESLELFSKDLQRLRTAIESGDSEQLLGVFTRAKAARDHFGTMLANKPYRQKMTSRELKFVAGPATQLSGAIRVPGDKSISHRSIMLGALAEGLTTVEGFLEGEDALATIQAFRDMGVVIEGPEAGSVKVHGVGLHGLKAAPGPLYLGNSGTSMRLLSGLLAAQQFDSVLTGDESLSKRPMKRVIDPLGEMNALVESENDGRPPLKISGKRPINAIHYDLPVASAQVKSAVLLAGLYADGETSVHEPAPIRDHTERMLRGFGCEVLTEGPVCRLRGGQKLTACHIDVPADISSAAFFMVAASIAADADVTLKHVGVNPTRTGIIEILRLMGADLQVSNEATVGGEPVADIRVRSSRLKGINIPPALVPLAIDEFPVLFIAACCAEGKTVLTGAEELRVKESDRIQVMADGLLELGFASKVTSDGIEIEGRGATSDPVFQSGSVDSHGDHRIAMAFSVAAIRAGGPVTIHRCANVATSFPDFPGIAANIGMQIDITDAEL